MDNKLYVLISTRLDFESEPETIEGIYTDKKVAEEWFSKLEKMIGVHDYSIRIEIHLLNQEPDSIYWFKKTK